MDTSEQGARRTHAALTGLERTIHLGKELVSKPEVAVTQLNAWLRILRDTLDPIYPANSEVFAAEFKIERPLSPEDARRLLHLRLEEVRRFKDGLVAIGRKAFLSQRGRVFIGHGHSPVWREVKDFIADRLKIECDEFNRQPVAGLDTSERLSQLLKAACFAFLIMTPEDQHADASLHARENVIHELGLFQGRLGSKKAIVLLEDGCDVFSNIQGISRLSFPHGHVSAAFEDMRRVLEREGILRP